MNGLMIFIKTLAHTLLIPGSVLVFVPYLLVRERDPTLLELDAWQLAGAVWIIVGIVIGSWCTFDFMIRGRGTPNPLDPPKLLVQLGFYRYVRNPGYVSVAFILLGETLFFRSVSVAIYAAVLLVGILLLVVLYEEPTLTRRYGESYDEYCRQVPRWIPSIRSAYQDV